MSDLYPKRPTHYRPATKSCPCSKWRDERRLYMTGWDRHDLVKSIKVYNGEHPKPKTTTDVSCVTCPECLSWIELAVREQREECRSIDATT